MAAFSTRGATRRARGGAAIALSMLVLAPGLARAQPADAPPPAVPPAIVDDAKAGCVRSFDEAQRLRQQGKLLAAQTELIACGQEVCPAVVQRQCVQWLRDLTASLPSIVVLAKDAAGRDLVDVRITEGATLLASSIDGRAIPLDPGLHTLRLEHPGAPPIEQPIVAVEGQQNRVVQVRFEPAPRPARTPAPRPAPTLIEDAPPPAPRVVPSLAYVGLSVGAAGLLTGTVAGIAALARASSLDDACPGKVCEPESQGDIDAGKALAHVSTAGLAVSALGLATGLVALVVSRPEAPKPALSARFAPLPGGGGALLEGRF